MSDAVIGLGSNLGNGKENIIEAWRRLGVVSQCSLLSLSNPYSSEPVGMASQHWFTNAIGYIKTSLQPKILLESLLQIEADMGRERVLSSKIPSDRKIDLDLIYYDDLILSEADLTIPHPEIQYRLFVLAPLVEVLPEKIHPLLGLTSIQILKHLSDSDNQDICCQQVKKMTW